jgi:hypothetical protein
MKNSTTQNGNAPTHIAYKVSNNNEKSYWTRIGVAFAHNDSSGFNIILDAIPFDGKITLRAISDGNSELN